MTATQSKPSPILKALRRMLMALTPPIVAAMVIVALALMPGQAAQAKPAGATFNVTTTNDTHAVNLTTGVDAGGNVSLRSAIEAANSLGGASTINLPVSTYNLSSLATFGELPIGDTVASTSISIVGAGTPANTTINAAATHRVFNVDPNFIGATFSVSNVSIKNGTDAGFGGGAIVAGGIDNAHPDSVTVTNCVLDSNSAAVGSTGGGAINWAGAGTLNIQNSTISNNSAPGGDGGGVYIDSNGNALAVTINNTTFSGNIAGPAAGAGQGGGLFLTIGANTALLTNVTFTSNQARTLDATHVGQGGGVFLAAGNLNVGTPNFVGNAATVNGGTGQGGAFYSAGGVLIVTNGTLNGAGGAGELFALNGTTAVTVRGATLENATTIFNNLGSATLTAYANNITAFTTAYAGGGTPSIGHNYWGTTDPLALPPAGLSAGEWAKRLGAPRNTWAEGAGSATLGSASLSGGSGTAVVVSYGRGLANAPFGNGITPFANQMCSDYYDFFTVGGSGTWTGQVPVDNNANCNTHTLTPKKVFWITTLSSCSPSTNTACWGLVPTTTLTVNISGQNLVIAGLTVAQLGGTPFVAGDPTGLDPTAVTLVDFRAEATTGAGPWGAVLVALVVLMSLGMLLRGLRRRTHA